MAVNASRHPSIRMKEAAFHRVLGNVSNAPGSGSPKEWTRGCISMRKYVKPASKKVNQGTIVSGNA
ncbi:hypothetical protein HW130_26485 [Streptomyces sp. PKU-EA00015]|uniref:hypothetical protein n=1 Tax=Streptomyces sp. PKU-EA00015 TaxID=2748326 RepID=UPI0015A465F7|nr:hypothetical protein [Streptomyces sp. PKU-EA00015]NWF29763.1 hypothetical protein [Streptomyces sp. PKU-EA00015]